jgi:hypothetical protein
MSEKPSDTGPLGPPDIEITGAVTEAEIELMKHYLANLRRKRLKEAIEHRRDELQRNRNIELSSVFSSYERYVPQTVFDDYVDGAYPDNASIASRHKNRVSRHFTSRIDGLRVIKPDENGSETVHYDFFELADFLSETFKQRHQRSTPTYLIRVADKTLDLMYAAVNGWLSGSPEIPGPTETEAR